MLVKKNGIGVQSDPFRHKSQVSEVEAAHLHRSTLELQLTCLACLVDFAEHIKDQYESFAELHVD
jgi:hypothetical protein